MVLWDVLSLTLDTALGGAALKLILFLLLYHGPSDPLRPPEACQAVGCLRHGSFLPGLDGHSSVHLHQRATPEVL